MAWAPDRGEVIWINFDPQAGREQSSHRPALVVSPRAYNVKTSLCLLCPMTGKIKGYPFEVVISAEPPSAVLADQVKSMDWRVRGATPKGRVEIRVVEEVVAKIAALIR